MRKTLVFNKTLKDNHRQSVTVDRVPRPSIDLSKVPKNAGKIKVKLSSDVLQRIKEKTQEHLGRSILKNF